MAKSYITLDEIAARLPVLVISCRTCRRSGRYRSAELVARYGAASSIEPFQNDVTRDCPKRYDRTIELGRGCAAICPDLSTVF